MCTDIDACRKRITCTITRVTVFYQQKGNGNIANQVHGFTTGYAKFILKLDRNTELARAVDVMMARGKRIYILYNQS